MEKIDAYGNSSMKTMLENMIVATSIFASNPALESTVRQANMFSTGPSVQVIKDIVDQYNDFFSGNKKMMKSFLGAFSFQTELLRNTQKFYLTETIDSFRNNLIHNNYFSAMEAIANSLQRPIIEVPDIALLRLNKSLLDLIDADLPRGLRTSIETLHTKTALDLSTSENISYNSKDSTFFVESNPEDNCKAGVVNVIFSVTRLFSDLTEKELYALLRHLSTYPSLGSAHPVGKKILEIVKNIETTISFDSEYFYHARTLNDAVAPYTDEDMTCAPHGITSYGRFNHIGDNYFYFSDQETGAVEEVRKHSPKNRVQVAKLRPNGKIRMVDISQNEENAFLNYCRFKFDPDSVKKIPREYLIPSYFSDCCKLQGFDGIKYYGTQNYKNYVTWKDGHFVFIDQEILDMAKTEGA